MDFMVVAVFAQLMQMGIGLFELRDLLAGEVGW
jgi:hypothetical protein